ncbi:MAG TPA: hypothetical protein VKZ59_08735 [Acidobacteriota bacterium]|nr:hypothetical protein [Acidobacteriota bacterium]
MFVAQQAGAALNELLADGVLLAAAALLISVVILCVMVPFTIFALNPRLDQIYRSLQTTNSHLEAIRSKEAALETFTHHSEMEELVDVEDPRMTVLKEEITQLGYNPND